MGLFIFFRRCEEYNPFREALHRLIELKGDKLIITSGYISEGRNFTLLDGENLTPSLKVSSNNGLT